MAGFTPTPIKDIPGIVNDARKTFTSGKTKSMAWRKQQLRQIIRLVDENRQEISECIYADLHRPELEATVAEAITVISEANDALQHLDQWAKPEPAAVSISLQPASAYIIREPLGVVAVIAPWNFPFQLVLNPLVAAIAAGNAVVVKPSEVAPTCAASIQRLIARYLDPEAIKVVQGTVAETTALLEQRFDHILYTGNAQVAQHVMKAAARYLTPVTLELGGKSPAIIHEDANLDQAAKRILSGKCLNAGQVCIAPDYLLVQRSVEGKLLAKLKGAIKEFFGDDVQASKSYGRIVNERHFDRIAALLKGSGGEVVEGGQTDKKDLFIAPTVITKPLADAPIMKEEIFGPLLPLLPYDKLEDAIRYVNDRDKPLALYVFTSSAAVKDKVLRETSSGDATVNDTLMHNAVTDLPFGGVGQSGIGAYHGKWGFDTFSHKRGVFEQSTMIDTARFRFPPYTNGKLRFLETVLTKMPNISIPFGVKDVIIVGLAIAVIVLSVKYSGK